MNKMLNNHPLVDHIVGMIRAKDVNPYFFRKGISDLTNFLLYESSVLLRQETREVTTPVAISTDRFIASNLKFISILRAGEAMIQSALNMYPNAAIYHFGLRRNETTLEPECYSNNLDRMSDEEFASSTFVILDPMLATGGSLDFVINYLKQRKAGQIIYLGILASDHGYTLLTNKHQDVSFFVAKVDPTLADNGFIIPGLGDCGDRTFGTK